MDFSEVVARSLQHLLVLTSNTLDYWVNLSASEPLTSDGSLLTESLAKIVVNVVDAIAKVLSQTF